MSEFDFSREPTKDERLSAETRAKLYSAFDKIMEQAGNDTGEEYDSAQVVIGEAEITTNPEHSLPILKINRPKEEFRDKYGWDYEVTYGMQDEKSSLHIIFPKAVTELPPKVTGYEDIGQYEDGGEEYDEGHSHLRLGNHKYPTRELSESDASRLLFDLHNAINSIEAINNHK